MRRLIPVVLLAALPLLAQPAPQRQRTIDVSGSATINVVPDEILIGLGVEVFAPTVESATSQNDAAIKAVLAALKNLGITDQKIRTDAMSLELSYRDSSHPSKGIEGYFARKTLTVTVKDAATAERAVSAALRAGANRIHGIDYNTTRARELRDEARTKASQAALEKARLLASQFGAKVGAPLTIREGYSMHYGGGMWGYGYGRGMAQQNVSYSAGNESSGETTSIPAGEMAVRAEVSVSFELLP